jgi:transposase-like protein
MAKTRRHSPQERETWAKRWHSSGLSGREFARQNGLEVESVYRWGREFPKKTANAGSKSVGGFTEVRVRSREEQPQRGPSRFEVEVELKNHRALRVRVGTDPGYVRELVEALESC